ncbi:MAG: hypothetical protein CL677_00150 [Bdellovibrionaceae bacterium]|nr:hypothetical protein [Pseudobdellovibrionaceae bacterium]|tara:strand:+ start:101293 stop:101961 length:669 start_codon:yes stop_codon:yes gene_type:complete
MCKSQISLILTLLVASAGLMGCASMSGLQTARVLEKGKVQSTFGGGYYSSGDIAASVNDTEDGEDIDMPFLEYSYRQGVGHNWDVGLKVTLIGTAVLDGKYNFYSGDKWALAAGLGLGYLSIETESGDEKSETTILDFMLPLYASYDVSEKVSIYTVPKYIHRSISGEGSGSSALLGATLGLKIGKEWGSMLEVGQFRDLDEDLDISQANVAFFWHPDKTWF